MSNLLTLCPRLYLCSNFKLCTDSSQCFVGSCSSDHCGGKGGSCEDNGDCADSECFGNICGGAYDGKHDFWPSLFLFVLFAYDTYTTKYVCGRVPTLLHFLNMSNKDSLINPAPLQVLGHPAVVTRTATFLSVHQAIVADSTR